MTLDEATDKRAKSFRGRSRSESPLNCESSKRCSRRIIQLRPISVPDRDQSPNGSESHADSASSFHAQGRDSCSGEPHRRNSRFLDESSCCSKSLMLGGPTLASESSKRSSCRQCQQHSEFGGPPDSLNPLKESLLEHHQYRVPC